MSSRVDFAADQLCYIPCNFCNIILAVSVPCSSLLDIVTVRCGHCTNLWSVNLAAAFHSLSWQDVQAPNYTRQDCRVESGSSAKSNSKTAVRPPITNGTEQRTVNRPPEKRQRVPSAYNQFIKEEIQRIKVNNPGISHREAFSTAAKNWAYFPHIQFGLLLESNKQAKHNEKIEKMRLIKCLTTLELEGWGWQSLNLCWSSKAGSDQWKTLPARAVVEPEIINALG